MAPVSYTATVPVRLVDYDVNGHVNHAAYATYFEVARGEFYDEVVDVSLLAADTVLAHLELDYHRPVEVTDSVAVTMTVDDVGRSSVAIDAKICDGDDLAATARSVQVTVDAESGSSKPLPESWRERLTGNASGASGSQE